jgi:hypothetical protein
VHLNAADGKRPPVDLYFPASFPSTVESDFSIASANYETRYFGGMSTMMAATTLTSLLLRLGEVDIQVAYETPEGGEKATTG